MSWIDELDWDDVPAEFLELKKQIVDPTTGRVDNIMSVHSLDLKSLQAHLAIYQQAMRPTKSLPKADREMIAMVVSIINDCEY